MVDMPYTQPNHIYLIYMYTEGLVLNNLLQLCHKTKSNENNLNKTEVELILYLLRTFCPHLGRYFCVVSSFTTFRPNFTSWPSSGDLAMEGSNYWRYGYKTRIPIRGRGKSPEEGQR